MALDTSIYGQIRPFRLRDPLETAGNALAVQNAQQANQLNALKFDEMQRQQAESLADEEAMRQYFQRGPGEQNLNALNDRPRARAAEEARLIKLAKEKADAARDKATTDKTTGETLDSALKRYRSALDFIDTPQAAARWMQAQYSDAQVAPHLMRMGTLEQAIGSIPQDPQQFQQWRQQQAMGLDKFADNQRQADNELIVRGPDGRPTVNEPLVGARSRVAAAGAPLAPALQIQLPDGKIGIYQPGSRAGQPGQLVTMDNPAGGPRVPVEPAQPGGKGTEGERAAAGFLGRMNAAEALIGQNPKGQSTERTSAAAALPWIGPYVERRSMTPEQQRFKQAADDWIRAKLRKESGAVIGKDEMAAEYVTYFPQPGDDPTVVEQKRQARAQAVRQMEIGAGPLVRQPAPAAARPAQPAPAPGDFVIRGVRPVGGP